MLPEDDRVIEIRRSVLNVICSFFGNFPASEF